METMNKEQQAVAKMVRTLISNGMLDELVVAAIEHAVDSCFYELEMLDHKPLLSTHQFQDYVDNIMFIRGAIRVLQYYTVNKYEALTTRVNKHSLRVENYY